MLMQATLPLMELHYVATGRCLSLSLILEVHIMYCMSTASNFEGCKTWILNEYKKMLVLFQIFPKNCLYCSKFFRKIACIVPNFSEKLLVLFQIFPKNCLYCSEKQCASFLEHIYIVYEFNKYKQFISVFVKHTFEY